MKALLLLAQLLAQAPSDAPKATHVVQLNDDTAVVVQAGDVLLNDGACMSDALAIKTGKRLAGAEAEATVAEAGLVISLPVAVAAVGAVVAAIVAASAGAFIAGRNSAQQPTH